MTEETVLDRVIGSVAEERGLAAQKIKPTDRLLDDLGMDGDDAVEFFAAFAKEYNVDLAPLYEHWDWHFGPEGLLAPWGLLPLLAFACWMVLARLGVPVQWSWPVLPAGVGLAIYFGVRGWLRRRARPYFPISVADLARAAAQGRWVFPYESLGDRPALDQERT